MSPLAVIVVNDLLSLLIFTVSVTGSSLLPTQLLWVYAG